MPELAEVEYYRKQWNAGIGARVITVELHAGKRIFRGTDTRSLKQRLRGARLVASEARGKQMAFRFSGGSWMAIHLGMTGKLRVEAADFTRGKHDHLFLRQKGRALVFSDPRQFGRVLFFYGDGEPLWWSQLPPALISRAFTKESLRDALRRHHRLAVKATLLLQQHFPGIGNWMADEVLWQTHIHPRMPSGEIDGVQLGTLHNRIRFVCASALKHVGRDFSDPPRRWLFHERWSRGGKCPRDGSQLRYDVIGGRTTAWCPKCQIMKR